jgi:hypothetical protein
VPSSCGADLRVASGPAVADTCAGGGAGGGNGILEAGEDATLSLALQNVGDTTATSLTGTLSTAQPGVVVTRPVASFADAAGGATVASTAPHFGIWVAPAVACGTVIPLTLNVASAQGGWSRNLSLTVGTPGASCAQIVCAGAPPAEDGVSAPLLVAAGPPAGPVQLTFGLSCHAIDSTVYWGLSTGMMSGVAWTGAACGFGPQGSAVFDPGTPPPGGLYYFVVVPSDGVEQGSYGHASSGGELPAAAGLGACNLPQVLGGTCP